MREMRSSASWPQSYERTSLIRICAPTQRGTARATLRATASTGPGVNNWDMLLQKTLSLSERVNLQFRAESYNLFWAFMAI
jgi:hypothetical protein